MQSAPTTDTHAELPRAQGPQGPQGYDRAQGTPGTREPQRPQGPQGYDAARDVQAPHGAPHPELPHEEPPPGAPAGTPGGAATPGTPARPHGDPRLGWSSTRPNHPPHPGHRRDGILPAVAAALTVRGETLTCTAGKADQPPQLHPLVQDFLDTLATAQRERFTGRCPEAILLSRHLTSAEENRSKRARKKPLTPGEARRSLKHAQLTARRIREDGDPLHGAYAPPCRSCTPLLAHFGVRPLDPSDETTTG